MRLFFSLWMVTYHLNQFWRTLHVAYVGKCHFIQRNSISDSHFGLLTF